MSPPAVAGPIHTPARARSEQFTQGFRGGYQQLYDVIGLTLGFLKVKRCGMPLLLQHAYPSPVGRLLTHFKPAQARHRSAFSSNLQGFVP